MEKNKSINKNIIIDCHTHCFPDFLAPRAMEGLVKTSKITPCTNGTVSGLKEVLKNANITAAFVCHIATNPKQQKNVNDFAVSINTPKENLNGKAKENNIAEKEPILFSFGSVHPHSQNIFEEVKEIKKAGLYGIKLHPDYVDINFNSKEFYPIFEAAEEEGLPIITHSGYDPVSPNKIHCTPDMLIEVKKNFKNLKLVAAHMGANRLMPEVLKVLCGEDIYIDTSMLHQNDLYFVREILLNHNPNRILFGSDIPWGNPKNQWEIISNLNLPQNLLEKLAYKNAEELFKIKI